MTPAEHIAAAERLLARAEVEFATPRASTEAVAEATQYVATLARLSEAHAAIAQAMRAAPRQPEDRPGWADGRRVPIPVVPQPPLAADPDATTVLGAVMGGGHR